MCKPGSCRTFSRSRKVQTIPATYCRALFCWNLTFRWARIKGRATSHNTIERLVFKMSSMRTRINWDVYQWHSKWWPSMTMSNTCWQSAFFMMCRQAWMRESCAVNRFEICLKTWRYAILAFSFVTEHTIESAPFCVVASRVAEAMVTKLIVVVAANSSCKPELFIQTLVVL